MYEYLKDYVLLPLKIGLNLIKVYEKLCSTVPKFWVFGNPNDFIGIYRLNIF